MTEYKPLSGVEKDRGSLLEKAAERYDLSNIGKIARAIDEAQLPPVTDDTKGTEISTEAFVRDDVAPSANIEVERPSQSLEKGAPTSADGDLPTQQMVEDNERPIQEIDRNALKGANFIVPDGPVTGLSEEFRIVKRQLLSHVSSSREHGFDKMASRILICSAQSGEGKTFCAINLALSIAAEQDYKVLLIDADFAKPGASAIFGLQGELGLMDALSNDRHEITDLIVPTDIPGFCVLPAGKRTNRDTEYLASTRTGDVLEKLAEEDPNRIMIFDSPPALAASPASELASHVGQALMIVRADKTSETALRDALSLVSRCERIQLLLNGVKFSATGRSFGSYYGYGEE